jgi:glutathione reductase (NADPH)
MANYDLVVIGTGVAAQTASALVREAGRSVAVIDHRPFGGTCMLRGCEPKKILVNAAESVDMARRLLHRGVSGNVQIDWAELIACKRTFTDPVPKRLEQEFAAKGIDAFRGQARFTAADTIDVEGKTLKGRHILIASGARAADLGFPGVEHLTHSDQFMELDRLPERIAMVGGGYIAAEFATVAGRAGAKVIVLQNKERMLPQFDPDLVDWLTEKFRELGVEVRTGTSVEAVGRSDGKFIVRSRARDGTQEIEADLVVHAGGRVPDIDSLDLPAGNIATKSGRLQLNEFLQSTSNPRVYAAGDAAAKGPPLTPVSTHDGKIAARNILDGNGYRPDYRGVPSVAFTLPPIAAVGLSENQARQNDHKIRVRLQKASDWYTARRVGESVYGFKTLVDEDSKRVLGAHIIGPHADEVINLFGFAIRHDLTADDLRDIMFAYPTSSSDIGYMF